MSVDRAALRAECERVLQWENEATHKRLWIALPAVRDALRLLGELDDEAGDDA